MKLSVFIEQLQTLALHGGEDLEVYYRHGSSGDCAPLSSAKITTQTDECGPFGLDGAAYVSIHAGH